MYHPSRALGAERMTNSTEADSRAAVVDAYREVVDRGLTDQIRERYAEADGVVHVEAST